MSLTDTQSELDHRRLPIDRVGVRGVQFPLTIADRERRPQHTVATVSMAVDLPHQYKGTHMSRFMQVLHSHGTELTVANAAASPRGGGIQLLGGKGVEVIEELAPLHVIEVTLQRSATSARLVPQGGDITLEKSGDRVTLRVPVFSCHQMIEIEC